MSLCQCPLGSFPETEDVTCKQNFGQVQKVIFCDLRSVNKGELPFDGMGAMYGLDGDFDNIGDYVCMTAIPDFRVDNSLTNYINSYFGNARYPNPRLDYFEMLIGMQADMNDTPIQDMNGTGAVIVVSPYLEGPSQEAGEARTFGGGNDTLNGVERFLGMGPSTFSAVIRGASQKIIKQLKKLECLAAKGYLGVILLNSDGDMELLDTGMEVHFDNVQEGESSFPALWPIPIRSLRISDKIHGGYEEPDHNEISWQFLPNYSDQLVIVKASELGFNATKELKNLDS